MRPIDADALENNLIKQLDKANHTERNVGIAMAVDTARKCPTVHEGECLMKFIDLCKLLPETQVIHLIFGDYEITGTEDSIAAIISAEFEDGKVVNIEAESDTLKVWVEYE